jgi:hypothetical protein
LEGLVNKILILGATSCLALALLAMPSIVLGDDVDPCKGKQSIPMVKKACEAGGKTAAKKAMKAWVKRVKKARKAAGETDFKMNCKACHSKMKPSWTIKDSAVETFKRHEAWLRTQGKLSPSEAEHVAGVLQTAL